tara:strand:+ start:2013 stop:3026 length:1014 start_codon:yes stop_codon:yes gene_type:complete
MNYLIFFIINILLITSINYVQHKLNVLIDINLKHKIYDKNKVPLSGGLYILASIFIYKFIFNLNIDINVVVILVSIFILGFFSDTKPNFKPVIRLLLQLFLIILLIIFCDLNINKTNIFFIDKYLSIYYFNLIFTSLCIIVYLNGSNFVDGVNTNLIGYSIIVLIFISNFETQFELNILLLIMVVFYLFNLFGKCFLGDNGVYIISILMSYIVINTFNLNSINPIFAINLLWYPAFENLFSIIRRFVYNNKVDEADKKHLHSLLYLFLNKLKLNKIITNSLTGFTICSFNLISIFISFKYMNNNQILISIITINILIYLLVYFKLLNILSTRSFSNK